MGLVTFEIILIFSLISCRRSEVNFTLETKKSKAMTKPSTVKKSNINTKPPDEMKFENYFDYKIPTKYIKPHQVRH